MSRYVFRLPDVGEGTAEVEIVKWHAAVDDDVREEQPLVDIMTDKATVEITSPVSGRIVSRKGEEGSRSSVGSELVVFEVAAGASAQQPETPNAEAVKTDAPSASRADARGGGKALAAPAVRARATALSIDLSTLAGTGPDGRIQHSDLDAILRSGAAVAAVPAKPVLNALEDRIEDIKIVGLRRRTAERLQDAKRRIPHFAYVEEVDVTKLEALRRELNASLETRSHLTVLPFLIRAVATCLATHPSVNAHFDDEQGVIRRFNSVHAGIAAQTNRGLLVPVIRHAERRDLWELAAEIARLSEAARSGQANREELTGSTITLSSLGALGGIVSTPIINSPEVAIIAVNRITERLVLRDGVISVRQVMNLSSSFDHRVVDGYDAASFIKAVKDCLEAPAVLIVAP